MQGQTGGQRSKWRVHEPGSEAEGGAGAAHAAGPTAPLDQTLGELATGRRGGVPVFTTLQAGVIIAGRYRIERELGRGGFGLVYHAFDTHLRRAVALKVLLAAAAADDPALGALLEEARTAAGLSHPNITVLHSLAEHEGMPIAVSEYLAGGTLQQRVEGSGPLTESELVALARELCRGLAYAHSRGIVHRDIKPANILYTSDGIPKLADFGLARDLSAANRSMSSLGAGTVLYAAPEQMRSASLATPASDIFSLAATLYFASTGDPPHALRLERVPPALRDALAAALEIDPSRRPPAVSDFLQLLGQPAGGGPEVASSLALDGILTEVAELQGAGDPVAATAALERARQLDPEHPQLASTGAALAADLSERERMVSEMEAALAAGDGDGFSSLAGALIDRWAGSSVDPGWKAQRQNLRQARGDASACLRKIQDLLRAGEPRAAQDALAEASAGLLRNRCLSPEQFEFAARLQREVSEAIRQLSPAGGPVAGAAGAGQPGPPAPPPQVQGQEKGGKKKSRKKKKRPRKRKLLGWIVALVLFAIGGGWLVDDHTAYERHWRNARSAIDEQSINSILYALAEARMARGLWSGSELESFIDNAERYVGAWEQLDDIRDRARSSGLSSDWEDLLACCEQVLAACSALLVDPPPEVTETQGAASLALDPARRRRVRASVIGVTVDHGHTQAGGEKGMLIHTQLSVDGLRGRDVQVSAFFRYRGGKPLRDFNGAYASSDGTVCVWTRSRCSYDSTRFSDYQLFLPYAELHMDAGGSISLEIEVMVIDPTTGQILARGLPVPFTYGPWLMGK